MSILFPSFGKAQYILVQFKDNTSKRIECTDNLYFDLTYDNFIVIKHYNVSLLEFKISDVSYVSYVMPKSPKPGDVNEDNKVNISDVVAVVNIMAGKDYHVTVPTDEDDPWGLCPDPHHPHTIDMGVAGLWSCCNVGASTPLERGSYFAWGETDEKDNYTINTYLYGRQVDGYDICDDILPDIQGSDYDAAHVKWGGDWVMPSLSDFKMLFDNCTRKKVTINGVPGTKYTYIDGSPEKERPCVFFPYVGYMIGTQNWIDVPQEKDMYNSYYWLSHLRTEDAN